MAKNDPIEGEVIESSLQAPARSTAVMLTPKQLRAQMARDQEIRGIVNEYIKSNMKEGVDFGSITVKGTTSKPSLLKPGGEKFCGLFKLRPVFRRDDETIEMMGNTPGILAYICELIDTKGRIVGEGRGTAKTSPTSGDFEINKQVKIAQKRAQIDAVLRTGGLSDFFTQDVEDMPRDGGGEAASDEPIDTTKTAVGFGKHKGKLWSDVPLDYLMWLAGSDGASSATAQQEIDRRASVAPDFGPEGTADHPDATTSEGDAAAAEAEAEYYGAHDTFHQD